MIGIYMFQNLINEKIYVGQSLNIQERYHQHIYDAENRPKYPIDYAIQKYGIDNFSFEILEECPSELLDEQEIYWISFFDSYNSGYNATPGGKSVHGEDHPRAILTKEQVWQIRELYNQHITRSKVFELFRDTGITERGFLKIWNCETWTDIHVDVYTPENKAWHKAQTGHGEDQIGQSSLQRAVKQEEIDQMVNDYNKGLSINAIAKKYNRDNSTVEKYIANPIQVTKVKYRGRTIKNINTGQIFKSISSAAKWASCGATTLTRHLATDKIAGRVPETMEPAQWEEVS